MPSQTGRPPCLAPALSASAILSSIIVALYFTEAGRRSPIGVWFFLFPFGSAVFNFYYLIRYIRRRSILERETLDGSDAWPTTPLFPMERGRFIYVVGTQWIIHWYLIIAFMTLGTPWTNNHKWTKLDINFAILRVACWAQVVASGCTAFQATRMDNNERKALCAQAHKMRCSRCFVYEHDVDKPTTLPSHPRVHPSSILVASTLLSAAFICALQRISNKYGREWIHFAVVPALTIAHHAYFLRRIRHASRHRLPASTWPSTPIFSRKWEGGLYLCGLLGVELMYAVLAAYTWIKNEGRMFWTSGPIEIVTGSLYVLIMVTLTIGIFYGIRLEVADNRAQCIQHGHRWKCIRLCGHSKDDEQLNKVDQEEATIDQGKKDEGQA